MAMSKMPGIQVNSSSSTPKKKPTFEAPEKTPGTRQKLAGGITGGMPGKGVPSMNIGPSPSSVPRIIGNGSGMMKPAIPGMGAGKAMFPPMNTGAPPPQMIPPPPMMAPPMDGGGMMPPPPDDMTIAGGMNQPPPIMGGGIMKPPMYGGGGGDLWGKYNALNNPANPPIRGGGMFGSSMRRAGGMFGR